MQNNNEQNTPKSNQEILEEMAYAEGGLIRACDVPYEPPRWLMYPYFQRGKGTLIQADNGVGKTAFMCAIAAHVSSGRPVMGIPVQTPGDVLILSVEDDLPVLRGRIEACGGDLTKCHFSHYASMLTLNDECTKGSIWTSKAKLVIFDPFQAFIGADVNMDKSNQTRPELAKLFEIANVYDCAVAIIAHVGKGSISSAAVNRSLGSVDIPAAMRSIFHLARNPDDPEECVAVHVKCSNAGRGKSLAFKIGDRGGVQWSGFSDMTPDDLSVLLSSDRRDKNRQKPVPYEQEPLVQVFRQLIAENPGGGFFAYNQIKETGERLLGFPAFSDTADLKAKLNGGLAKEIREREGVSVTCGHKKYGTRGIRIEKYPHQSSFIETADDKS